MSTGDHFRKETTKHIQNVMDILNDNPSTTEVHYAAFQAVDAALRAMDQRIRLLESRGGPASPEGGAA